MKDMDSTLNGRCLESSLESTEVKGDTCVFLDFKYMAKYYSTSGSYYMVEWTEN